MYAVCSATTVTRDAGEDLTLPCTAAFSPEDSLHWWLHRSGVPSLRFCYAGNIKDDLTDKYTVEPVRDGYNLTIRNLTVKDTGTYICKKNNDEIDRYAVNVRSTSTVLRPTSSSATNQAVITGSIFVYRISS